MPIIFIALAFMAYAPALTAPYMWDDLSLIEKNPTFDDHTNLFRYFTHDLGLYNQHPRIMGFYRPLQAASFHIEIALFGKNATAQRAINILLHGLAAFALYLIARSLMKSKAAAILTGLLLAAHPLCSEQVCLVANRGGLATGVLSLWTLAFFTLALPEEGRIEKKYYEFAIAAYIAALLFKPEPLTLFIPLAAWLWLARPKRLGEPITWLRTVGVIAGIAVAYAIWRWGILGISHGHKSVDVDLAKRILAVPALTLNALRLSLLPAGLRAIRSANYDALSAAPLVAVSTIAWLALFAAAYVARRKSPVFAFAAVLFAAAIAPYSGLVALIRPVAEHYYYLPCAAACLALGGISEVVSRRRAAQWITAALVVVFSVAALGRAFTWQSEEKLWTDNLAKAPDNSQVLNNLGTVYAEKKDFENALNIYTKAALANPANIKARLNRANIQMEMGHYDGLLAEIEAVLKVDPCDQKALVLMGRRLAATTHTEDLGAMIQNNPCAMTARIGAGMEFDKRGKYSEAAGQYRQFIEGAPNHPLTPAVMQNLRAVLAKTD